MGTPRAAVVFGIVASLAVACGSSGRRSDDSGGSGDSDAGSTGDHGSGDTLGSICRSDGDCTDGKSPRCVHVDGTAYSVCTSTCISDADCGTGGVCVFGGADGANSCRRGCAKNGDCSSGFACSDSVTSTSDTTASVCAERCASSSDCANGAVCNGATGLCGSSACTPQCDGRHCGTDGCGGSCGSCAAGESCSAAGQCTSACTPDCAGAQCGDDGCGGQCGTCAAGELCDGRLCSVAYCGSGYVDCNDGTACPSHSTCDGETCVCNQNFAPTDCAGNACAANNCAAGAWQCAPTYCGTGFVVESDGCWCPTNEIELIPGSHGDCSSSVCACPTGCELEDCSGNVLSASVGRDDVQCACPF